MQKSLAEVPVERRSPYHEQFARRAEYIVEHVKPIALEKLNKMQPTQGVTDLRDYIKAL